VNPVRLRKLGEYGNRVIADSKECDPAALEIR
jgi:hypothetical protein